MPVQENTGMRSYVWNLIAVISVVLLIADAYPLLISYSSAPVRYATEVLIYSEASNDLTLISRVRACMDNNIPEEIYDLLKQGGWSIVLTDKNLSKQFFNGQYLAVVAVTVPSSRQIYISTRIKPEAIEVALCHEVGHVFDWEMGTIALSDEFDDIYKEESGNYEQNNLIYAGLETKGEREFFACVFADILLNPKEVARSAPGAASYIQQRIGTLGRHKCRKVGGPSTVMLQ